MVRRAQLQRKKGESEQELEHSAFTCTNITTEYCKNLYNNAAKTSLWFSLRKRKRYPNCFRMGIQKIQNTHDTS